MGDAEVVAVWLADPKTDSLADARGLAETVGVREAVVERETLEETASVTSGVLDSVPDTIDLEEDPDRDAVTVNVSVRVGDAVAETLSDCTEDSEPVRVGNTVTVRVGVTVRDRVADGSRDRDAVTEVDGRTLTLLRVTDAVLELDVESPRVTDSFRVELKDPSCVTDGDCVTLAVADAETLLSLEVDAVTLEVLVAEGSAVGDWDSDRIGVGD